MGSMFGHNSAPSRRARDLGALAVANSYRLNRSSERKHGIQVAGHDDDGQSDAASGDSGGASVEQRG